MAFYFKRSFYLSGLSVAVSLLILSACSHTSIHDESAPADQATSDAKSETKPEVKKEAQPTTEVGELKATIHSLQSKIDMLEAKISMMNDKLDVNKAAMIGTEKASTGVKGALPHPANSRGVEINPSQSDHDPEAGFSNDSAVSAYRQAMILFEAQKDTDALVYFGSFLERFADHPLAGSAQFYSGECYLRQKEYAQAAQEYQRVITSYDRSPHVADALKQLAYTQDMLHKPQEAARLRNQLLVLFPQSPAARDEQLEVKTRQASPIKAPTTENQPVVRGGLDPPPTLPMADEKE